MSKKAEATPRETSATIEADLQAVRAELVEARTKIDTLAASYDAAILEGDAQAEAHERDSAIAARNARRAELRIPELEAKLAAALEQEQADRCAIAQAEAEKSAIAFIARLEKEFHEPAQIIQGLMTDWRSVEKELKAAGVPTLHQRLSVIPGKEHPERTEFYEVWFDADGNQIAGKDAIPGVFIVNDRGQRVTNDINTQRLIAGQYSERRQRIIPGRREAAVHLDDLPDAVKLPGYWSS